MVEKTEEVPFLDLYDEDGTHQHQFTMTETLMDKINRAMKNPIEPMVWMINRSKKHTLYSNALPIHKKNYDVSNMLVYKNHTDKTAPRAIRRLGGIWIQDFTTIS